MDDQPMSFPQETDAGPEFLTLDAVLEIHRRGIEKYGGISEIRDMGLLESAIAQPQAGFGDQYLHRTIYDMAAAYLYHITQNHPFVDGNKRAGAAAANVFLLINGQTFDPDDDEFVELLYATARGEKDKAEIAEFIRQNCHTEKWPG